jgi:ketosteroid isomerase-like protein
MTKADGDAAALIERYLAIVASDDYERFGELLTDDCTFTLMPIGRTWSGRDEVMSAVMAAGYQEDAR